MLYYLNNWRNRKHADIYGGSAIYDLWADGVEDKRARAMTRGDICLILSRLGEHDVTVGRYVFTEAVPGPDDAASGRGVWVLKGTLDDSESLSKVAAAKHPIYARFFNKLGHVCQWGVLRG